MVTPDDLHRGHRSNCRLFHEWHAGISSFNEIQYCLDGSEPHNKVLNFLPLTYNGEAAKMTWPKVTDIEIPRHKFCWYGYPSVIP